MRFRHLMAMAFCLAAGMPKPAGLAAQQASSPPEVSVEAIYRGGPSWIGRSVQLRGKVARWERSNSFFLEDNFGAGIEVFVDGELPSRGSELVVTGFVAVDPAGNPYLQSKELRSVAPIAAPTPQDSDRDGVADVMDRCPGTSSGATVDAAGCPLPWYRQLPVNPTVLTVTIGLLFVGVGVFLAMGRSTGKPSAGDVPPTVGPDGSEAIDEGKTIRIARPDETQGTLQILPGRLEICSGPDAGKVADIRFVRDRTANAPLPEVTFGRLGIPSPTHVVLKSPTVSRLHGKFRFDSGRWYVINFSETNPVLLNKRPIGSTDSPVLVADQDVIEMGEVGFRYHA
jgi:hypothetical protein